MHELIITSISEYASIYVTSVHNGTFFDEHQLARQYSTACKEQGRAVDSGLFAEIISNPSGVSLEKGNSGFYLAPQDCTPEFNSYSNRTVLSGSGRMMWLLGRSAHHLQVLISLPSFLERTRIMYRVGAPVDECGAMYYIKAGSHAEKLILDSGYGPQKSYLMHHDGSAVVTVMESDETTSTIMKLTETCSFHVRNITYETFVSLLPDNVRELVSAVTDEFTNFDKFKFSPRVRKWEENDF